MKSPVLVGLDGSGVGMRCPTQGWLVEMNSPILVGLDVLDIGMHYFGEENELTWYKEGKLWPSCAQVFYDWDCWE